MEAGRPEASKHRGGERSGEGLVSLQHQSGIIHQDRPAKELRGGAGLGGESFGKTKCLDLGQRSGRRLEFEAQALELPGERGVLGRIAGDEG